MITQYSYYLEQADKRKSIYAVKAQLPSFEPNITRRDGFLTPVNRPKPKQMRPVRNTKTGIVYDCVEDACEDANINSTQMYDRLKYGKEWQYVEELKPVEPIRTMSDRNLRSEQSKCKQVRHIPTGTIYESIRHAGDQGISPFTTVKNHCHGHCKRPSWEFV